jgi:hypothetical protein
MALLMSFQKFGFSLKLPYHSLKKESKKLQPPKKWWKKRPHGQVKHGFSMSGLLKQYISVDKWNVTM